MTNCPNCGAPITGPQCEYCDTMFSKPKPDPKGMYSTLKDFDLLRAKTIYLRQQNEVRDLYISALKAMRNYGGCNV